MRRSRSRRTTARAAASAMVVAAALLACGCAASEDEGAAAAPPLDAAGARHAPAARAGPEITQRQLVGLNADQLADLLGAADFRRDDGPVELWQYRAADCVLDLYLYADPASDTWKVAHAAARDLSAGPPSAPACVSSLLQRRHARAAG